MICKYQAAMFAVFGLFSEVTAEIKKDGLWTGHDFYKEDWRLGVMNGIPYSKDSGVVRMLKSATPIDGDVSDYKSKANVKRVMAAVSEDAWKELFPIANELYTYDGFLQAVGKY